MDNTYSFRGKTIKYSIDGNGPALVMVHGTPWSSFNFRNIIEKLALDFTVYTFDLLGYGQSDKSSGDVSLGVQNQVLEQLLDYWNIERPYIVGHDFGGATVLRNHLLNGRQYRKIVLIDAVAVSPWGSEFFRHVRKHEDAFAGTPDHIHKAVIEAYIKTAAYKQLPDKTMKAIIEPWTGNRGKAAFYRQIAQADSIYTDEIEPLYKSISTPTLILWGKEDSWIPVDRAYRLQKLIPESELKIIPEAGHLVIEEKPEQLAEIIQTWLKNRKH